MRNIKIHAVIVTYQPDLELLALSISQIYKQVSAVTLVDNHSDNSANILTLIQKLPNCNLIQLSENLGVGAAQNTGLEYALARGAQQLLILDQDSVMAENAVNLLSRALLRLESSEAAAAVGPQYDLDGKAVMSPFVRCHWFYLGRVPKRELTEHPFVEVDFLISSGSLLSAKALRAIGQMDEALFIDHVDTEWCLRARANNFRLFGIRDAFMRHSLGEQTYRVWLGRWRLLPKHKPFRYYFTFRNSLLLARKPHVPLKWFSADCTRLMSLAIFCLLSPEQKFASIRMAWRGLKDGYQGRCPPRNAPES
ncbi:glycosyltransferase family 2 protein [Microbulbifer bruguierae]|uniref:Glycosyltransferase family 2 protein n=1 Tax=Microbulbifer bruguierae TaxID=3029061 RepID=A0ABY8NFR8_9GAMM|nr:glycosyltransferase family 2 protein [Microbulbifer bruguierae]WGL17285.1 glycosyltransferase family 2 protein [Microbulbifer bruguierae]